MRRFRGTRSSREPDRQYALPRDGVNVWRVAHDRDDLIQIRSEAEMLRQCRVSADDPRLTALAARAKRSSDADLLDLLTIMYDAQSALVDCTIEEIDLRFPDIRQEITMATIQDAAAEIREAALAAGEPGKPGSSAMAKPSNADDKAAATQATTEATTEATSDDATADVTASPTKSAPDDTRDSSPAAEAPSSDAIADSATPPHETEAVHPPAVASADTCEAADETATNTDTEGAGGEECDAPDQPSTEPQAVAIDAPATTAASTEVPEPIPAPAQTEVASATETPMTETPEAEAPTIETLDVAQDGDEPTSIEDAVDAAAALVDQIADQVEAITGQPEELDAVGIGDDSSESNAAPAPVEPESTASDDGSQAVSSDTQDTSNLSADAQSPTQHADADPAPTETAEALSTDAESVDPSATSVEPAHVDNTATDTDPVPQDEPGNSTPDVGDSTSPAIADPPSPNESGFVAVAAADPDSNTSWTEPDPSSPNGFLGAADEIETGVRCLIDFFAVEVREKWRTIRSTFEAANELKARTEESLTEAKALCAELKSLQKQVAGVATAAETTANEARLFRDEAREARGRADAQAREAELAADRASTEASQAERHALRAKGFAEPVA